MVELLEIKMNREGRILLPESISLQSDEVNICISEMQLKTITDKTAQCMFCGSEHNIFAHSWKIDLQCLPGGYSS